MSNIDTEAGIIADSLGENPHLFGFDPVSILSLITTLLPLLVKCLHPNRPEDVSGIVKRSYQAGKYDRRLFNRTTHRVMRQGQQQGLTLSVEQAREVSTEILDHARESDAESFAAVFSEAAAMPDAPE
jgi:hypothetical protein